jgi:hypothetical protein
MLAKDKRAAVARSPLRKSSCLKLEPNYYCGVQNFIGVLVPFSFLPFFNAFFAI